MYEKHKTLKKLKEYVTKLSLLKYTISQTFWAFYEQITKNSFKRHWSGHVHPKTT